MCIIRDDDDDVTLDHMTIYHLSSFLFQWHFFSSPKIQLWRQTRADYQQCHVCRSASDSCPLMITSFEVHRIRVLPGSPISKCIGGMSFHCHQPWSASESCPPRITNLEVHRIHVLRWSPTSKCIRIMSFQYHQFRSESDSCPPIVTMPDLSIPGPVKMLGTSILPVSIAGP